MGQYSTQGQGRGTANDLDIGMLKRIAANPGCRLISSVYALLFSLCLPGNPLTFPILISLCASYKQPCGIGTGRQHNLCMTLQYLLPAYLCLAYFCLIRGFVLGQIPFYEQFPLCCRCCLSSSISPQPHESSWGSPFG